jgi:Flp pilus assembly protein TadG
MAAMTLFSRIKRDKRGATLVEFAIVAPVLLTIIMGIMDVAYNQYARGVLEGEVQRAARKLTMESAADIAKQTAMDTSVKTQFLKVVSPATVTFKRTWYTNYEIATKRKEDFSDTNGNSTCDNGEAFEDANRNSVWDTDASVDGSGGAKDAVLYTVTATYKRVFPMATLVGAEPNVTLVAATVLRNQPFGDQAAPTTGNCP